MPNDPSAKPHRPIIGLLTLCAGTLSAVVLFGACGGSGTASNPQTLLQEAKATLDSTSAVHFTLQSSNVASKGTVIRGGTGDLVRPDQLKGSLEVIVNGFQATVNVVAVGNTVVAQLPFAAGYSKINPSTFGLGNPSGLLNPQSGLSSVLTAGNASKVTGTERIGGELLDDVTTSVPGSAVPLLPNDKPSEPVSLVAAIDPGSHQLRKITLTGPFVNAASNSTFTVTLTNYGERVQISLPPAS